MQHCLATLTIIDMHSSATIETLDQISRNLDERLKYAEDIVTRLSASRCVLRKHVRNVKDSTAGAGLQGKDEDVIVEQAKGSITDDDGSNPSLHLDKILSLARNLRTGGTGRPTESSGVSTDPHNEPDAGSVASSRSKPSTRGRQTLGQALSATNKANPPSSASTPPVVRSNAARDVAEQVLFLARYRIPPPLCIAIYSKDAYCERAKFLSSLLRRPVHPESALYSNLVTTLPPTPASPPSPASSIRKYAEPVILKLANSFAALISEHERWLRGRVSVADFKASRLSPEERKFLVTLWLRGRKLVELYEHVMKRKSGVKCVCQPCRQRDREAAQSKRPASTLVADLHMEAPLAAPLSIPSAVRAAEQAKAAELLKLESRSKRDKTSRAVALPPAAAFAQVSLEQVNAFHSAYRSRVQCVVEASIGQELLMATVQTLRGCCEQQTKSAVPQDKADQQLLSQWVSALRQYRSLYNSLLCDAQSMNECMFVNK